MIAVLIVKKVMKVKNKIILMKTNFNNKLTVKI